MDIFIGLIVAIAIAGGVYYAKRKKTGRDGSFDRNDPPSSL